MNWRAAVTVARLTARLAMPRSLWALFLVALIVIVLVAVAVLKEPVESGSRGAFWLAMAQAFSGMGLAVLCTLLGRSWRRIRTDPTLRLLPHVDEARLPLGLAMCVAMIILLVLATTILATDGSWKFWRTHEMESSLLSPYFVPQAVWIELGATLGTFYVSALLAARYGLPYWLQAVIVATAAFAGRAAWYLPVALLVFGLVFQRVAQRGGVRLQLPIWRHQFQRSQRINAFGLLMRRRMQPWFVGGLTTLMLALSMVGDGNTFGVAALSGTYALTAVSAVELRSAWLVPGAVRRGGIGDALFRIWFTDCARTTLLALLLVTVAVLLLSGSTATHGQAWWQDADAAMTLRRRLWSAAAATTAMLGVAWTGLRIMTASPRYLTSGPASMGSGQWIVLAVALAIPLLQLVLGTRDWPGLNRDWCRSVECTAVFSALLGPIIAAFVAKAKRPAWERANLAAVANTLDAMARNADRSWRSWSPSGTQEAPRLRRG